LSSRINPVASHEAPGLQTLLKTTDFGEWDHAVSNSLGHHRSRLLPQSPPFAAQMRSGAVEEFKVLLLQGRGQVELLREQAGHGVLWLPLQGWSVETVNGQELLAEPGMGLLFRPGDVMRGWTSASITGISILLPESTLAGASQHVPLLHQGIAARRLINAGQQLANAAAQPTPGSRFAAEALSDALQQWANATKPDGRRERITTQRRRTTVAEACLWMEQHLGERFSMQELSAALGTPARTLQASFQQELGCTPMAQAKRLRLHRLRQLLLDRDQAASSISDLMAASGLLACGATAADYRQWCGELPSRTRQRA
jgi:AraC-like DNA-binding protein